MNRRGRDGWLDTPPVPPMPEQPTLPPRMSPPPLPRGEPEFEPEPATDAALDALMAAWDQLSPARKGVAVEMTRIVGLLSECDVALFAEYASFLVEGPRRG